MAESGDLALHAGVGEPHAVQAEVPSSSTRSATGVWPGGIFTFVLKAMRPVIGVFVPLTASFRKSSSRPPHWASS